MHKITTTQRYEVVISDVQGKLSNLYLWPGTLTSACLKFQVIRGDVVEQQEITPLFDVNGYEVRCNYRFTMAVPMNCSHIHLYFISGDVHPVSGKPKLIARSRLSFKDICRHAPLDKYFTLYRRDRVTQNCIAGGYVRLGFFRHQRRSDEELIGDERVSMDDHVSICSSARDELFPYTHPFDPEMTSLPPRPDSAVARMIISRDIQTTPEPEEGVESTSSLGDADRSFYGIQSQRGQSKSIESDIPHASSSGIERTSRDTEDQLLSVTGKLPEQSGEEGDEPRSQRGHNIHPLFGILFGATLGVIGTVAVFTLRYLSRRNSKKRRAKKGIVTH